MISVLNKARGLWAMVQTAAGSRRWRMLKDGALRYLMAFGGVGVIIAIALIFFYLLYVVFPLFVPASAEAQGDYPLPASVLGETLHLAIDEQNELGLRLTQSGHAVFFKLADGTIEQDIKLAIPTNARITSFATLEAASSVVAFGLSNGSAVVFKYAYDVSYPNDVRRITPRIDYPLGKQPIVIDTKHRALKQLAVQGTEEETTLVAVTRDGRIVLSHISLEVSMLSDEISIEQVNSELMTTEPASQLLIEPQQRTLYLVQADTDIAVIDITDKSSPQLLERVVVTQGESRISSVRFLVGGISLLVGTNEGKITQWFPVRDEHNRKHLTRIRGFTAQEHAITDISIEQRRKGFLASDAAGKVAIYHSTAKRNLLLRQISQVPLRHAALSPRADAMIAEDAKGRLHLWHIKNEHPEVSWAVLWNKVWYENYPEPAYIWQSSSASNDFEPKFNLTPLTFGTFKAAFYAMLMAVPLAIMGAIYTAYFMAPGMRVLVKPAVEVMEALPTVILGFLAGLWLAPLLENHLPGAFSLLLILPVGTLLVAWAWQYLPKGLRLRIPDGWQAAILIPVLLFFGWFAFAMSQPLEQWLFAGDMRHWLDNTWGLDFDQRNAMVVGIAMGIAVVPTIFSITEDAIFSVPKHLSYGSLALGATPWQTLVRVVLLTASPGIFSAIMIGLGRAVGETMIVLMATGNTPVMDLSIFQGMRTLSANIAVEMPESELNSTHYRVLFLAALVLFMFTFIVNTMAEIVRQRLRRKYSSL